MERERIEREDPMRRLVDDRALRRQEKYARVEQLMLLVDEIRAEEAERKRLKDQRRHLKKQNKEAERNTKKPKKSHKSERNKSAK